MTSDQIPRKILNEKIYATTKVGRLLLQWMYRLSHYVRSVLLVQNWRAAAADVLTDKTAGALIAGVVMPVGCRNPLLNAFNKTGYF